MDPTTVVVVAALLVIVLIAARTPVFAALLIGGTLGLVLLRGTDVASSTLAQQPFAFVASFTLLAIPLFVAMGVLAQASSMPDAAFNVASKLTARVPGGLAVAAITACAAFAAISGSSVATATAIGPIAIQKMSERGYSLNAAAGVIAASGTMGVLIPPSIVLVIYGILTGESIGQLLLAGFVPGLISAVLYGVMIVRRAKRHPELYGAGDGGVAAIASSALAASPAGAATAVRTPARGTTLTRGDIASVAKLGIVFLGVVGGIYSGYFTAVEAGAVGTFLVLFFVVWERLRARTGLMGPLGRSLLDCITLNSMVFALMIGASVFTVFTVSARVPQEFTAWASGLAVPGWIVVAVLLLILIPLGMFLDGVSMMLITVPIAYPVITELGFSGIWFGILVVKMIEVSLITPPVGVSVFVVSGLHRDLTPEGTFRGVAPFFVIDLLTIALLFAFPAITLWLPGML